ncbi:Lysosomal Cystine Transporter [Ancylostoma duodenale]|uniref:Lysosomal Cystine Transporter n=1 Tax=Ancylostoma duodenale TaxID=51022 RepID=A0A0C2CE48_9BILA|nr:Lysosomal Cystine Transporter [Ancylostoma duodenale]
MSANLPLLVSTVFAVLTTIQTALVPEHLTVIIGRPSNHTMKTKLELKYGDMELQFRKNSYVDVLTPLVLDETSREGVLQLAGKQANKGHRLEAELCRSANQPDSSNTTECNEMLRGLYLEVTVLKSSLVAALVMVVGWAYFTAWSTSFYPQMLLNFKRKSVIGLNFDFLVFNIVGFLAYSAYNVFMYFDSNVQAQYEEAHPHSPIPVLLNDVFFPTHALAACILTALQCFIYKRGNQRVSYVCMVLTAIMGVWALVGFLATWFKLINLLQYVTSLSYIKMLVTLFKYIPQCWNVSDWTAFYGNPVKFGLGVISIAFDILFMVQHYILYPHRADPDRGDVEQDDQTTPDEESGNVPDKEESKKRIGEEDSSELEKLLNKVEQKGMDQEGNEGEEEEENATKRSGNESTGKSSKSTGVRQTQQ